MVTVMPTVNREPIKVAIIEDTPALGKLIRKIVDAMDGIETFGVWENAEDGLKAIEDGGPDVVLMDISLPGMSGIDATVKVKEKNPGIDVIMLTVHDEDQKIFDALQAGASGYLLKNASPDDLCRAIFEVRAGGAPMSAEIARLVVEAFHRPASSEASQAFNLSKRETENCATCGTGPR